MIRVEIPADQLFNPDTAQLKYGADATLRSVGADLVRNYPQQMIGIEGHTDNALSASSQAANAQHLSVAQATAVYDALVRAAGMPANQLFVVGHGRNHPVVSNASEAGQARNRRIELVIYPETMPRVACGSERVASDAANCDTIALPREHAPPPLVSLPASSTPRLLHPLAHDRHHRLRHGQPPQRAEGVRARRAHGDDHRRPGRARRRRRSSSSRASARFATPSPPSSRASSSSRSAPRSPRANRSSASASACSCCSIAASKTASTKASA